MDNREMARLGGLARAKKLTPKRRTEIARAAILARWAKKEHDPTIPPTK